MLSALAVLACFPLEQSWSQEIGFAVLPLDADGQEQGSSTFQ